ncbi:hypothetical protein VKT23_007261 [Stygiomarasmius scandens]|uniref:Uncharacterized protein n=1 Tax=Marasmiellus scandens TaxID=2682957 RepID=A0ABR1JJ93_9AGAR
MPSLPNTSTRLEVTSTPFEPVIDHTAYKEGYRSLSGIRDDVNATLQKMLKRDAERDAEREAENKEQEKREMQREAKREAEKKEQEKREMQREAKREAEKKEQEKREMQREAKREVEKKEQEKREMQREAKREAEKKEQEKREMQREAKREAEKKEQEKREMQREAKREAEKKEQEKREMQREAKREAEEKEEKGRKLKHKTDELKLWRKQLEDVQYRIEGEWHKNVSETLNRFLQGRSLYECESIVGADCYAGKHDESMEALEKTASSSSALKTLKDNNLDWIGLWACRNIDNDPAEIQAACIAARNTLEPSELDYIKALVFCQSRYKNKRNDFAHPHPNATHALYFCQKAFEETLSEKQEKENLNVELEGLTSYATTYINSDPLRKPTKDEIRAADSSEWVPVFPKKDYPWHFLGPFGTQVDFLEKRVAQLEEQVEELRSDLLKRARDFEDGSGVEEGQE